MVSVLIMLSLPVRVVDLGRVSRRCMTALVALGFSTQSMGRARRSIGVSVRLSRFLGAVGILPLILR